MKENSKTQIELSEGQLQGITGGTPKDATNWYRNLSEEERSLLQAYKRSQPIAEAKQGQATALATQYARLRRLSSKILSDGTIASRVGVLRPKV
jgi:hypothetical protein